MARLLRAKRAAFKAGDEVHSQLPLKVCYVGTPTYDAVGPEKKQTDEFALRGCVVESLRVTHQRPSANLVRKQLEGADIVIVSGGNTQFAMDRWEHTGNPSSLPFLGLLFPVCSLSSRGLKSDLNEFPSLFVLRRRRFASEHRSPGESCYLRR